MGLAVMWVGTWQESAELLVDQSKNSS